jgi:hypothetical protein
VFPSPSLRNNGLSRKSKVESPRPNRPRSSRCPRSSRNSSQPSSTFDSRLSTLARRSRGDRPTSALCAALPRSAMNGGGYCNHGRTRSGHVYAAFSSMLRRRVRTRAIPPASPSQISRKISFAIRSLFSTTRIIPNSPPKWKRRLAASRITNPPPPGLADRQGHSPRRRRRALPAPGRRFGAWQAARREADGCGSGACSGPSDHPLAVMQGIRARGSASGRSPP